MIIVFVLLLVAAPGALFTLGVLVGAVTGQHWIAYGSGAIAVAAYAFLARAARSDDVVQSPVWRSFLRPVGALCAGLGLAVGVALALIAWSGGGLLDGTGHALGILAHIVLVPVGVLLAGGMLAGLISREGMSGRPGRVLTVSSVIALIAVIVLAARLWGIDPLHTVGLELLAGFVLGTLRGVRDSGGPNRPPARRTRREPGEPRGIIEGEVVR